jgi:hypothetical protein
MGGRTEVFFLRRFLQAVVVEHLKTEKHQHHLLLLVMAARVKYQPSQALL